MGAAWHGRGWEVAPRTGRGQNPAFPRVCHVLRVSRPRGLRARGSAASGAAGSDCLQVAAGAGPSAPPPPVLSPGVSSVQFFSFPKNIFGQ